MKVPKYRHMLRACCERCGAESSLVVHHKNRDRSNNADSNLETLCRRCHVLEHAPEISEAQRRDDVNMRRGASIRATKKTAREEGKRYPLVAAASKQTWAGEGGEKLRAHRASDTFRETCAENMKRLMNDPAHIAKRKRMKEQRNASST